MKTNKYFIRSLVLFLLLASLCLCSCRSTKKQVERSNISLEQLNTAKSTTNTNTIITANTDELNTFIQVADSTKPIIIEKAGNKTIYTNAKNVQLTASHKKEETEIKKEDAREEVQEVKLEQRETKKDKESKGVGFGNMFLIVGGLVVLVIIGIYIKKSDLL